ncbi:MAG TPA: transcriptional repressor [Candidatus Deferrimicrobiaceae bacterium]
MKKSRNTRQRSIILEILREEGTHLTAEAIYQEARKTLPNISLGTVYRNLNFLNRQGMVREIRSNASASSVFEGNHPPHAHFHCTNCNSVLDVPLPDALSGLRWQSERKIAVVESMEIHITGACSQCAPAPVET